MGGGLMQLVAYGAQDIYLTGNPQITFFKVVYRRHTNFSMEAIQQTVNGSSTLVAASNTSGTVTVSRNGDLVGRMYVRCDQDTSNGISGDQLIKDVTLEIGGQQIDKHTREWLQVWAELSTSDSKAAGYKYLTGGQTNALVSAGGTSQQSVMVPLQFYFCRNPGLALPLIALQYHEVKVKFTWGTGNEASRDTSGATPTCEVWADYIYLDTEERRRFAQVSHEYLIEQLQYQEESSSASQKIKLNFNHPVKELIWTNAASEFVAQKTKLTLNGHDRFAEQHREYFQLRQPLDHHTAVPGFNVKETERPQLVTGNKDIIAGPDGNNAFLCETGGTLAAGQWEKLSATSIQWANTDANHAIVGDIRVGDILFVRSADDSEITTVASLDWGQSTNASLLEVLTVTTDTAGDGTAGNTATLITFSADTAFSKFLALTPEDAKDPLQISLVARVQDPLSRCSQLAREINVYSFALKPEEHQPSGTCNFSRIDTAHLQFSAASGNQGAINVYAVNYNVLRVMSGMGGLAYSN